MNRCKIGTTPTRMLVTPLVPRLITYLLQRPHLSSTTPIQPIARSSINKSIGPSETLVQLFQAPIILSSTILSEPKRSGTGPPSGASGVGAEDGPQPLGEGIKAGR